MKVTEGTYRIQYISFFSEADIPNDSCQPESSRAGYYPCELRADTLDELLNQFARHVTWSDADPDAYELNACGEPGRIDYALMTLDDDDLTPATERDIERWKQGELALRYTVYSAQVERVIVHEVKL